MNERLTGLVDESGGYRLLCGIKRMGEDRACVERSDAPLGQEQADANSAPELVADVLTRMEYAGDEIDVEGMSVCTQVPIRG